MARRLLVALSASALLLAFLAPGVRNVVATHAATTASHSHSASVHAASGRVAQGPMNIHLSASSCPPGTKQFGSLCCPPNSKPKGTQCFCDKGYSPKSGKCVKDKKPVATPKPQPTPKPQTTDPTANGGTDYVSGTMASDYTMTMTGAISVGHTTNLDWTIPAPEATELVGYSAKMDAPTFTWSQSPDSIAKNQDSDGRSVYVVHWDAPKDNTVITMVEKLHVTVSVTLADFTSSSPYPLASLSPDVQKFIQPRDLLKLPDSINDTINGIKNGATTEQQVVIKAANWVATYLKYDASKINVGYDASSAYATKLAACRGYDDLLAGVLLRLGIPSMSETGWVSSIPVTLPGPNGSSSTIQWSDPGSAGELHTWINIYFPGVGWVPFDPQYEKFFVDSRHIGFIQSPDASLPAFDIAFDQYTNNGQNIPAFGTSLGKNPDGSPRFSDYPADGLDSKVTVDAKPDASNVTFRKFDTDITGKMLFSR